MKMFRFYTVRVDNRGERELRWKWEDSSTHEQAARDFIDLNRCIDDARRHGFLGEGDARDDKHGEDPER